MKVKLTNIEIVVELETVELVGVHDVTREKTLTAELLINGKYSTSLFGFKYEKTWEDSEVLEWAKNELIKNQVSL